MRFLFHGQVNFALALVTVAVVAIIAGFGGTLLARDKVLQYTLAVAPTPGVKDELTYGMWPELSNTGFFESVKKGFLDEKASFIEANLTAMQLRVYDQGELVVEVPIKSKGKEGSWWETPSGLYRAEGKERKHFSSFGHVWMPYSVPFQGNFFIHGWPYYEDGTPVSSTYSGGCIRLANEYAEQVFGYVEVGMPILVFEEEAEDDFSYSLDVPDISAQSYLVADLTNNFVLLAGETKEVRETGLAAKLMTALVASEYQNIEKTVRVPDDAENDRRLVAGREYSLYELLFPLLMEDSDVAARAIGSYFGEKRFLRLLDYKAQAIGMTETRFADPAGKIGYNASTPEDLFQLLKYLTTNRPFVLSMSAGTPDTRTYGNPPFDGITSSHPLSVQEMFAGGAFALPGTSEAESRTTASVQLAFTEIHAPGGTEDLVTVLRVPFNESERLLAVIVLDSDDAAGDTRAMKSFVEERYH